MFRLSLYCENYIRNKPKSEAGVKIGRKNERSRNKRNNNLWLYYRINVKPRNQTQKYSEKGRSGR